MAMLCDLGKRPIHLFVINPAWGRRARHVRLSRCQDGARESQRRSVTVCHWNKLRSGRFSSAPVPFSKSLERPGERQFVAVRIGHMEIAFSPGGISRNFWIKSPVLQMIPESVHIRDVEDKPSPVSHSFTLLQIEDRRLSVSCAQ